MKRRLLPSLLLALALALTACATKPAAPTAADFEVQPGEYRYQDMGDFFVETEQGQYYLGEDQIIRFAEPGSRAFYPLCNKPNCGHGSDNCNAYSDYGVGYWNGHLYTTTYGNNGPVVQRMDMDGANRREVGQLPILTAVDGARHASGELLFHNGSLFYMYDAIETDPEWAMSIYQFDLETGKGRWLFQEDIPLHTEWPSEDVSVSNGYLYFPLPQANTEKRAYAEGNLETGRIERVFEDWDVMSSQIVNLDGVLHYFRAGVGLCEYDKASNQESVKFPMDVYCAEVSYTKDYIFMRTSDSKEFTQRTLWALDRDYQLLGKVEQERIGLYFPFLEYTTANAIYFSADGGTITHYIDPHHLDRLELIQLADPTARSHG